MVTFIKAAQFWMLGWLVKTPKVERSNLQDFARCYLRTLARVVERAPHDDEVSGSIRENSLFFFFAFVDCVHCPQASSASLAVKNLDNGEKFLGFFTGFDPF